MASVGNTLCLVAALLLFYQKTASPVQPKTSLQDNKASFLDVCHWVHCGGGICNKTNLFLYKCNCNESYKNVFNIAILPCINQHCGFCVLEGALGKDCSNQGTLSSNSSSSSPPPPPDSSKNQAAGLNLRGSSLWLIASLLYVSLAPWSLLYILSLLLLVSILCMNGFL